jgi:NDP-sugar pyrophosphorylase family protein
MSAPLAVVLAGGQGTRIRHLLGELPKPLAPVAGRPFLEWQLRYLHRQGITRVVLSTGYRAQTIDEFAARLSIPGLEVHCVREEQPLGTGGGFLHAVEQSEVGEGGALVCNGDSLVLAELRALFSHEGDALLAVEVADASRFGSLRASGGFLQGFAEKRPGAGLINAGVYRFRRATIARFPRKMPLSFEYDVFPALLDAGVRIGVVPCQAPFLDIGTEQTLGEADAFIRGNRHWFE